MFHMVVQQGFYETAKRVTFIFAAKSFLFSTVKEFSKSINS